MGFKKKDGATFVVGVGVSPLPPPFLKVDSDITWPRLEKKTPRLLDAPRERFLPAKNPSAPLVP